MARPGLEASLKGCSGAEVVRGLYSLATSVKAVTGIMCCFQF